MEKRAIYKYRINQVGKTTLTFPFHTEIIHFDCVDGEFFIWVIAILETEYKPKNVEHVYRIVGTGWEFDDNWYHQGTIIQNGFVWHLLIKDE